MQPWIIKPSTEHVRPRLLIVPTLCVVTPPGTLRVPPSAASSGYCAQATRSVTGCIPTLCVVTPPGTLRVPPSVASLGYCAQATRSVTAAFPRGSVGTICVVFDRSHALRGNASSDAPRPAQHRKLRLPRTGDAERHGLHSHAGAWERSVPCWTQDPSAQGLAITAMNNGDCTKRVSQSCSR